MRSLEALPVAPSDLDSKLCSANLCSLAIEASSLTASQAAGAALIDIQQPCMSELKLLVLPVTQLQTRLKELLDEWPENPLLDQLVAICDRLLGMLPEGLFSDSTAFHGACSFSRTNSRRLAADKP